MFSNVLNISRQIRFTNQLSNFLRSSYTITTSSFANNFHKKLNSTLASSPAVPLVLTSKNSEENPQIAKQRNDIIKNINTQLKQQQEGRLFAVIHLCGKQFKVTSGDIIIIEGYWPPTISDRIKLDKVLIVGGQDFTLIGRPILNRELVDVQATIIEKTLSHTKTRFRKKPRKQFMRINFYRGQHTMIRINSIEIKSDINSTSITKPQESLRIF